MPPKKARAFNPKPKSKSAATTTSNTPKNKLPKPFVPAPKALEPFTSSLNKNHVYITSLDSHPKDFKKRIFLVPVIMNILIMAAIIYRGKVIGPYYMKICFSLMGKRNETTMNTRRMASNDLAKELLRRTGTFMLDLLIYSFVWPWPKAFFLGQKLGNPVAWRTIVGFRDQEIVVRRSRKWFLPGTDVLEEGKEQDLLFGVVGVATEPMWMSEKTGYLMLNKEWDLDWTLIIKATKLVDKKVLSIEDFKTTILVHHEEHGWLAIETAEAGGSLKEDEGRRKIVAFKDKLTAMGKEDLFFRWIEIVQYESSRPGEFGPERQQQTVLKARELFESNKVDFDKFWEEVGGMKGMPGMEVD
ncbi:hypothetical protein GLAREA_05205 [Glarea lozoyensis ATCC 20868]|uniref:Uncharacterized protein n=1 Tax=Glarea lozoyensis (strain ATCC 20868 / MF5171) TaxID=1116229 RepID=S3DBR5_GLAL2|nr:uncharacterized protein GLAREA_05205 [Glarea lozoyensis ATCC 20868]EPE35867.1 hypothetical protein GLAREA_05205 [Glarea lozoyensis ATCC 20868]